jgi:hypothetical protein
MKSYFCAFCHCWYFSMNTDRSGASPVVIGKIVNWEVHDAADHDHTACGRENPVNLSQSLVGILNMFKCIKTEDATHRFGRKIYAVQVKNPVNTQAFTHVSTHIIAPRKKETQVRKSFLTGNLKSPELVYRFREWQACGRDRSELLDVLSHVFFSLVVSLFIFRILQNPYLLWA